MEVRVARIAVDVPLPHLDRPFDYAIDDGLDVRVGQRVRVRFASRLVDGYVLDVVDAGDSDVVPGKLAKIERLVSSEVVLTPPVAKLARAVADHYCGVLVDVLRLAIPKRQASIEAAGPVAYAAPLISASSGSGAAQVLPKYSMGPEFLAALARGGAPRAAWTSVPVSGGLGSISDGVFDAVAATIESDRAAIIMVPDQSQVSRWVAAAGARFGRKSVLEYSSEAGPATRYRRFLSAKSGQARIVIGSRSAVFAPGPDLGLLVVVDEGSDLYVERRAPYCHAREVAAIRAHLERCGLLFASPYRPVETQRLVESGWLRELRLPGDEVRRLGPLIRVASDRETALGRDAYAFVARLPHDVFGVIRSGLAAGPVLVQVPRAGYIVETESGLRIGVKRTAEELGKAFPNTPVVVATGESPVSDVGDAPALVVATPGAEPVAETGYAAAIVLDTGVSLGRIDLRAPEEAVRRWLLLAALVRPAERDGTMMIVGELSAPTVQSLVRLDPVGFAQRELATRGEVGFPPVAKLVQFTSQSSELISMKQAVEATSILARWAPAVQLPDGQASVYVQVAATDSAELLTVVKAEISRRSAKKLPPIRVQVDPVLVE